MDGTCSVVDKRCCCMERGMERLVSRFVNELDHIDTRQIERTDDSSSKTYPSDQPTGCRSQRINDVDRSSDARMVGRLYRAIQVVTVYVRPVALGDFFVFGDWLLVDENCHRNASILSYGRNNWTEKRKVEQDRKWTTYCHGTNLLQTTRALAVSGKPCWMI